MRMNRLLTCALILAVSLTTVPAFAQVGGVGAGVGLGGQTHGAGAGAGAGAQVDGQTAPVGLQAGSADRVAAQIQSKPEVASRVQSLLPSGMSMSAASAGFKNEGQFLAALHASQNLGIPFDQLKARMTGSASTSLGAAIQASKPGISDSQAKAEAKKAEAQAKATASAKAATSASVR